MVRPQFKSAAISLGITANASVTLAALFVPKMLTLTAPKSVARSVASTEYDSNHYAVPDKRRKDGPYRAPSHGTL